MSNQNGPNWYPSKQFVHSPPPPSGAPSNLGRVPDPDGVQPAKDATTGSSHEPSLLRRFVNKFKGGRGTHQNL
jgi:hypothetical protein